jgi:hypothetical protein
MRLEKIIVKTMLICLAGAILAGVTAIAQEQPAEDEPLTATILEIKGRVKVQMPGAEEWAPAEVDQVLPEGAVIRCGLGSHAVIRFSDNSIIKVERGAVRIESHMKEADAVVTRLGMAYGTVKADVERGEVKSDFAIRTPVATMAVRGTEGIQYNLFRGSGEIEVKLWEKGLLEVWLNRPLSSTRKVRPGEMTNQNLASPINLAKKNRSVNFVSTSGMTDEEKDQIIYNGEGSGAIDPTFGNQTNNITNLGNEIQDQPMDTTPPPPPPPHDNGSGKGRDILPPP